MKLVFNCSPAGKVDMLGDQLPRLYSMRWQAFHRLLKVIHWMRRNATAMAGAARLLRS